MVQSSLLALPLLPAPSGRALTVIPTVIQAVAQKAERKVEQNVELSSPVDASVDEAATDEALDIESSDPVFELRAGPAAHSGVQAYLHHSGQVTAGSSTQSPRHWMA
ncbi:hypothetical protein [Steroidobacter sp.]|uniref:hypothetical protein n=1 Tax=Steroidobacter sp. TaxID=1978227 RepID=UPI001A5FD8E4|nr:hypothetical protein [Steroidobacter sp.]MBL8267759.1 hypothetical protein [Steroidobacter sp.]